jgi:hypothetical protein
MLICAVAYVILAAAPSRLADGALLFLSNSKKCAAAASHPSIVTFAFVALLRLGTFCTCGALAGLLYPSFSSCSVESLRMLGIAAQDAQNSRGFGF